MPKGYPNPKPDNMAMSPVEVNNAMREQIAKAEVIDLAEQLAEMARMREVLLQEQAEVAALKAKLERKAEIREEVSDAVMQQRRQDFGKRAEPVEEKMPPKPEGIELVSVKMEKNYRPKGYYEIGGWLKPAVFKKKFGHEKPVMIEPEEYVKDERAPPSVAGTGFANKIWAGTTLRLPEPEAREVVKAGIASRGFD